MHPTLIMMCLSRCRAIDRCSVPPRPQGSCGEIPRREGQGSPQKLLWKLPGKQQPAWVFRTALTAACERARLLRLCTAISPACRAMQRVRVFSDKASSHPAMHSCYPALYIWN